MRTQTQQILALVDQGLSAAAIVKQLKLKNREAVHHAKWRRHNKPQPPAPQGRHRAVAPIRCQGCGRMITETPCRACAILLTEDVLRVTKPKARLSP